MSSTLFHSVPLRFAGAPGFLEGEGQERLLSYLPLSHIAGMAVDITMPAVLTALSSNYDTRQLRHRHRVLMSNGGRFPWFPMVFQSFSDCLTASPKTTKPVEVAEKRRRLYREGEFQAVNEV